MWSFIWTISILLKHCVKRLIITFQISSICVGRWENSYKSIKYKFCVISKFYFRFSWNGHVSLLALSRRVFMSARWVPFQSASLAARGHRGQPPCNLFYHCPPRQPNTGHRISNYYLTRIGDQRGPTRPLLLLLALHLFLFGLKKRKEKPPSCFIHSMSLPIPHRCDCQVTHLPAMYDSEWDLKVI